MDTKPPNAARNIKKVSNGTLLQAKTIVQPIIDLSLEEEEEEEEEKVVTIEEQCDEVLEASISINVDEEMVKC